MLLSQWPAPGKCPGGPWLCDAHVDQAVQPRRISRSQRAISLNGGSGKSVTRFLPGSHVKLDSSNLEIPNLAGRADIGSYTATSPRNELHGSRSSPTLTGHSMVKIVWSRHKHGKGPGYRSRLMVGGLQDGFVKAVLGGHATIPTPNGSACADRAQGDMRAHQRVHGGLHTSGAAINERSGGSSARQVVKVPKGKQRLSSVLCQTPQCW